MTSTRPNISTTDRIIAIFHKNPDVRFEPAEMMEESMTTSLYQTHAWGNHKGRTGWVVYRFPEYRVQAFVKAYPFPNVAIAWIPGIELSSVLSYRLFRAIKERSGAMFLYVRIYPYALLDSCTDRLLRSRGWKKATAAINSGQSIFVDIDKTSNDMMAGLSKNWKRNLLRGFNRAKGIYKWSLIDPVELHALYRKMEQYKGIPEQHTLKSLESIMDCFGDNLIVYGWDDQDGRPAAVRGCIKVGCRAFDVFAAATAEARKSCASYVLLWRLFRHCSTLGVKTYDMGGVDEKQAVGVYNFKKGTGGEFVEFAGEWEMADLPVLRWAVNWKIARRGTL